MTRPQTALVLGAGSSCAYGFPTGDGLRSSILALRNDLSLYNAIQYGRASTNEFLDAFRESQLDSIDAFLGREVANTEIGKRLVAYVLLQAERGSNLFKEDTTDHWYRYFLNQAVTGNTWEELDLSWLSVVTFNYDRSFEHFLLISLSRIYGREQDEVLAKISEMKIVHVYGTLGQFSTTGDRYVPYKDFSENEWEEAIYRASSSILIVPEGRDDSPHFAKARDWLGAASSIYFLGFGFDKVNIARLHTSETLFLGGGQPKVSGGTAYGLTNAEVLQACQRLQGPGKDPRVLESQFFNLKCVDFLRHTLVLSEP